MKRTLRKALSLICIIAIIFSINIPVKADIGGDDEFGVLQVKGDRATPKEHQALSMTVSAVNSDKAIQAFCEGWTFTFSNDSGSITVYVPLLDVNKRGGTETYTFPLTSGWTLNATGIKDGKKSIRELVSNKTKYDTIIKDGCHVHADAKIQKYSYSNGKYTGLNVYANSRADIDNHFSEFTDKFKTNTKNDYFDLNLTLAAEPPDPSIIPEPIVSIYRPLDQIEVEQGTTIVFIGFGKNVHHMAGYVDGKFYGTEQQNPNKDISVQMRYETTVTLNELGWHTFQDVGRNTALATDEGSILKKSEIRKVKVVPAKVVTPETGKIQVIFLNDDTKQEIEYTRQTISGVKYGELKTISKLELSGYEFVGSCQTFETTIPDKSKMTTAASQSVTLSATNKEAYLYFLYKAKADEPEPEKPPVTVSYPPEAVLNNTAVVYAGDDVSFDGSKSYDVDGTIEHYEWSLPGAYESNPGNEKEGTTWYAVEGTYGIGLKVTDDSGLSDSTAGNVIVLPPKPQIIFTVSDDKQKENRKITLDVSGSTAPKKFPIDWSLTKWTIEPVTGSEATGDFGVRFEDGTVYKNVNGKAQLYSSGKWTDTGKDFNSVLSGQKTVYFQARDSGKYIIVATITGVADFDSSRKYTSTETKTINVKEDLPPAADFSGQADNTRDMESPNGRKEQKYGICPVACTTKSPDGDPIGKRVWVLRWDSDNDGSFEDEEKILPYTGAASDTFTSGIRFVVNGDSDPEAEIWTYNIGHYAEELTAYEDIPDSETVKELLIESDYLSNYARGW
jgi:FlaG/FlaF family flagellin (archaellin)